MNINTKLLRAIQRRIKKEPKQFIMYWYFRKDERHIPNCGTAACIAGWAVTLTKTKSKKPSDTIAGLPCVCESDFGDYDIWIKAGRALRLTDDVAHALFKENNWPAKFQGSSRTLAKRGIARIDHLIKTGE